MRPRKVKLFLPAWPATVNEPLRVFQRVHALPRRLERAAGAHLPPALRPAVLRWTVNLTELTSDKLNETLVPIPVAAIDAPDFAALKLVLESEIPPSTGFVVSTLAPVSPPGLLLLPPPPLQVEAV
jgi:hypothetical protein